MATLTKIVLFLRPFLRRVILPLLRQRARTEIARIKYVQDNIAEARETIGEAVYDFYRCEGCRRPITRVDEINFSDPNHPHYGTVCQCGSMRFSPIDYRSLRLWEWLRPNVLYFTALRFLGWA